jgi:hypothetical protein
MKTVALIDAEMARPLAHDQLPILEVCDPEGHRTATRCAR